MNREIKFRAYDKEVEKMTYFDDEDYLYNYPFILQLKQVFKKDSNYDDYEDFEYEDVTDKVELMEYTGLHDKNGKEIYEGDIIEFSYDVFTGNFDTKVGRGTIEFIAGAFYIKPFEIEGRKVKDTDNEEWFLLYTVNIDTLKVIGNIYDNSELLGGVNKI